MPSVNSYFDDKVTSIAFQTATLPATVGVMEIGEYEFGTSEFETMSVVSCLLYTSPSPRDRTRSRMPSSA